MIHISEELHLEACVYVPVATGKPVALGDSVIATGPKFPRVHTLPMTTISKCDKNL
jgi:hypothetical protein